MFAAGSEIPYVMAQVGHEDSKLTLQIYARVLKRRDRDEIGRAFDHLLLGLDETEISPSMDPVNTPREARERGRTSG
jgi:hypothetical protein